MKNLKKLLDRKNFLRYFVNTMNELAEIRGVTPDQYQVAKLQALITEMVRCCEDRRIYEHDRFGLPWAEARCLALFLGERYLTVKTLAEKMDVAKSRITKIIDHLEEKGMVKRLPDPGDARVTLIGLTQKGSEKMNEIGEFHREIHGRVLSRINPDERHEMLSQLEKLRNAMESVKATLR